MQFFCRIMKKILDKTYFLLYNVQDGQQVPIITQKTKLLEDIKLCLKL